MIPAAYWAFRGVIQLFHQKIYREAVESLLDVSVDFLGCELSRVVMYILKA